MEVDSVVGHLEQSCVAVSDRLRNAETAMIQFTERAADLQKRRYVGLQSYSEFITATERAADLQINMAVTNI